MPDENNNGIDSEEEERLLLAATMARLRAYAPYSGYMVGAALLGRSGRIHVGCNVENASYGATICAERAAITAAVLAGDTGWHAILVVADGDQPPTPCGICRQCLAEFGDLTVISRTLGGQRFSGSLRQLLPHSFGPQNLEASKGSALPDPGQRPDHQE